jgi:hypothetical protein
MNAKRPKRKRKKGARTINIGILQEREKHHFGRGRRNMVFGPKYTIDPCYV